MSALIPYLNDPVFLSLLFSSGAFIISLIALLWVFLRPDQPTIVNHAAEEDMDKKPQDFSQPPAVIKFKEHSPVFGEKADCLTKQSYKQRKTAEKTRFL